MRGLVLSFSTMLIAFFLILSALLYVNNVQKEQSDILASFFIEKAGFVGDDIEYDVNKIIGTGIDVNRGSLTQIYFTDKMPGDINKLKLLDYNSFVNNVYSVQQNADIELQIDNLVDGKTELIFTNGLQYDYSYLGNSVIDFYKPGLDTEIITYDITISINDSSVDVTPWTWQDVTGDINVNLNFVDENVLNNVSYNGKLDSGIENTYQWDYSGTPGDSFTIKIGSIGGNSKALQLTQSIDNSSSQALISIEAVLNSSTGIDWYYNADLNYTQADVNINRKIGYSRG